MIIPPEQLLSLLAEAIRSAPRFEYDVSLTADDERWLGRVNALVEAAGNMLASMAFRLERDKIGSMFFDRSKLMIALQDCYAFLELKTPDVSRGAFIPPGDTFNGFAALVRVIKQAKRDLYFVDPYVDATLFTELAPIVPAGVRGRCLTGKQSFSELLAAHGRWVSSGQQSERPFEVRQAKPKTLHDRFIVVDNLAVWSVSQSFRDIAARSAASVTEDRTDLAVEKRDYLNALWDDAQAT